MTIIQDLIRNRLRIASVRAVEYTEKSGWPCMPVMGAKNELRFHTLVDGGLRIGRIPGGGDETTKP